MIHGIRNGFGWLGRAHRLVNWTDGCVALTDAEMDQVFNLVPDGTRIDIRP
jgi:murein L,D-transpeptidase YafK